MTTEEQIKITKELNGQWVCVYSDAFSKVLSISDIAFTANGIYVLILFSNNDYHKITVRDIMKLISNETLKILTEGPYGTYTYLTLVNVTPKNGGNFLYEYW